MFKCLRFLIVVILIAAPTVTAAPKVQPGHKYARQLQSTDKKVRASAEKQLVTLGADAVDGLVFYVVNNLFPDENAVAATLRILEEWERRSWTERKYAVALDTFVNAARDPNNSMADRRPLSIDSPYPYWEKARVLDISPDDAAAYLQSKKGIKLFIKNGYCTTVAVQRDWGRDVEDWLYIANLAREVPTTDRRHLITISVKGVLPPEVLVECFKHLRKSSNSPFYVMADGCEFNRDALFVLKSYPGLTSVSTNYWTDDISDNDWADCIRAWQNLTSFTLPPSAGPKAIAALSKSKKLHDVAFRNEKLTPADLEPLRNHKTLRGLYVRDAETRRYTEYLTSKGTGIWQKEEEKRAD